MFNFDSVSTLTPPPRKTFNFFETLFYSLFSRDLYRDVFRRWAGAGILYLAFLTAIWAIPVTLFIQADFDKSFQKTWRPFTEQIPHMTFDEDGFKYEGADPYTIRDPRNNQILVLFTRSTAPVDAANIPAFFIFTPRQLAMRDAETGLRIFNISPKFKMTISAYSAMRWSGQLIRWAAYFIYPFAWSVLLMLMMFLSVLYAVFGKLVAFLLKMPVDFQDLYRLANVALTPMMPLMAASLVWTNTPYNILDTISLITPLFFIALGLWYNRPPKKAKSVS